MAGTPPKSAADAARKEEERKLDEELEATFPASDPPSATNPSSFTGAEDPARPPAEACEKAAESDALDEALEETFPASDVPALVRKHGEEDADPGDACDMKK